MGLLNILKDPKLDLKDKYQRRMICILILTKLRHNIVKRFSKVLIVTRRNKRFNHFAVEMKFYAGSVRKEKILHFLRVNPKHQIQILQQAEKIVSHCFNLLGSGEINLGDKINWHLDFKSGYLWPRKYYHLIERELSSEEYQHSNADIKVPWELSRFQHLVVLGQAYWVSGDEKYTEEFMTEILSWIEENPPEIGVNWVCSMDISLRAVNMIIAYFYFRSSLVVEKGFWERFYNILYYSGLHIEKNSEISYRGLRNNHHLTNCAALIWLGLFFGGFDKRTIKWLKNGMENLVAEMEFQVNTDGGSFEGSISYHRLAMEIFLYTTILAENNGLSFPETYISRLAKMCEFSMNYLKPNGLAPQFGDADDGRFCILSGYGTDDMRDHRSVLGVAGEYFHRDDFRKMGAEKCLDGLWLFGHYEKPKDMVVTYDELVSYPDTGYYIIRNNLVFLMIKCGTIGQKGNGGHDHNDQLSFELSIDGVDLIIDPGSYVYTMDKELRYLFRSTKYHNVSQIGGFEQNIIKSELQKDMFTMYSSNSGKGTFFGKTKDKNVRFSGHIDIAGTEIQYVRSVELSHSEKRIDILDTFKGQFGAQDNCTCRLHLAKDVQAESLSENVVKIWNRHVQVRIETETPVRVVSGVVAHSYGSKYEALVLIWDFQSQTQFKVFYV